MSDLLLKVNQLNLRLNQHLRLPNILTYDPDKQKFILHGNGTSQRRNFIIHNLLSSVLHLVFILPLASILLRFPENLSMKHKFVLILDAGIVMPLTCTYFILLSQFGHEIGTVANWSLSTKQKYNFRPSRKCNQKLSVLFFGGKKFK